MNPPLLISDCGVIIYPPRNDPPGGIIPTKVITPSIITIQKNNHDSDIP